MHKTTFRVSMFDRPIGHAVLLGQSVKIQPDDSAADWTADWLRENVVRLCQNLGHSSKYITNEDTDTGISVERVSYATA